MKIVRREFLQLAGGHCGLAIGEPGGMGATILSGAPGAHDHRLRRRRRDRHHRALDRAVAHRAARPDIHRREPPRRRHQSRRRGGHQRARGRLHAAACSPANAINATLYEKLNFNFIRDVAPVAGLDQRAAGHAGQPVASGEDRRGVHRLRQGQSRQAQHGSGGTGVPSHVAGELFKMMAKVNLTHSPIAGEAPAVTDLIGGQVQVAFRRRQQSLEHVKAGTLRALAVTSAARAPALPNVPTVADTVPDYEASSWFGIGAPKNTPADIIETAAPRDRQRRRRFQVAGAVRRARRHPDADDSCGIRQAHRRRNREVGRGGQVLRRQGGLISSAPQLGLPMHPILRLYEDIWPNGA